MTAEMAVHAPSRSRGSGPEVGQLHPGGIGRDLGHHRRDVGAFPQDEAAVVGDRVVVVVRDPVLDAAGDRRHRVVKDDLQRRLGGPGKPDPDQPAMRLHTPQVGFEVEVPVERVGYLGLRFGVEPFELESRPASGLGARTGTGSSPPSGPIP